VQDTARIVANSRFLDAIAVARPLLSWDTRSEAMTERSRQAHKMRALALLLLVPWALTGCARWQATPVRRLEQATLSGKRVRLTMSSGEQVTLAPSSYRPLTLEGSRSTPRGKQRVRVDLLQVRRAEQQDHGQTSLWIGVGIGAAVLAVVVLFVAGGAAMSNSDFAPSF
jgi:hypothetical protein